MISTLSPTLPKYSADLATTAPALDVLIQPPSLGKRASRAIVRFLIVFCIAVAATLAWQSYGDAARAIIATSWPQLAWLAPEALPQAASQPPAAAPAATASPELQQLREDLAQLKQELEQFKEIPSAFASLRQRVDQVAAGQQQIAGDIAKLATRQQEVLHKLASPPPARPAAAPKPKPVTPPSSETR
jgi:hypothetical protein